MSYGIKNNVVAWFPLGSTWIELRMVYTCVKGEGHTERASSSISMRIAAAHVRFLPIVRTLQRQSPLSGGAFSTSANQRHCDSASLTPDQINLLIPRLCQRSDLLPHAARLLDAILLLPSPPPLASLSLPVLFHHLARSPDASLSMSLLTRLARNPRAGPHLLPIAGGLFATYVKARKTKEAMTLFRWMSRPENLRWGKVDGLTYALAVSGFCRNGKTLEALKVLKGMVGEGVVPGEESRRWIYRSLLREARVREAIELDAALCRLGEGGNEDKGAAFELIAGMVREWRE